MKLLASCTPKRTTTKQKSSNKQKLKKQTKYQFYDLQTKYCTCSVIICKPETNSKHFIYSLNL